MADGDVILRVQNQPVATPDEVWAGVDAARADKRDFVLMLVLPKVRDVPGPKWLAAATGPAGRLITTRDEFDVRALAPVIGPARPDRPAIP